jgi:hypothetical protein
LLSGSVPGPVEIPLNNLDDERVCWRSEMKVKRNEIRRRTFLKTFEQNRENARGSEIRNQSESNKKENRGLPRSERFRNLPTETSQIVFRFGRAAKTFGIFLAKQTPVNCILISRAAKVFGSCQQKSNSN